MLPLYRRDLPAPGSCKRGNAFIRCSAQNYINLHILSEFRVERKGERACCFWTEEICAHTHLYLYNSLLNYRINSKFSGLRSFRRGRRILGGKTVSNEKINLLPFFSSSLYLHFSFFVIGEVFPQCNIFILFSILLHLFPPSFFRVLRDSVWSRVRWFFFPLAESTFTLLPLRFFLLFSLQLWCFFSEFHRILLSLFVRFFSFPGAACLSVSFCAS